MAGVNVSTDAQREYDKEEGKQKEEEKKDEEEEEYGEEEARDYAPEAPKVCNTCGCRDERPIRDHDSCAGCEAMADLGEAFAFYPTEHPTHRFSFLSRIRSILRCYWQRVGVSRPERGITAPRPGDRVVINGSEMIVPDPPSSSGEDEERESWEPRSWV